MWSQAGASQKELQVLRCEWRSERQGRQLYSFHGHCCVFTFFWQTCGNFICDASSVFPDVESFQLLTMQHRFFSITADSSVFTPACSVVYFRTVPSICFFSNCWISSKQTNKQNLDIIVEIILTWKNVSTCMCAHACTYRQKSTH